MTNQYIPDNSITNINNLYDFMNLCRIEKSNNLKATHISMGNFKGSYHITEDKLEKFRKLYRKYIKNSIPSILELHLEQGPIVIDLDFKYTLSASINLDLENNGRKYLLSDITKIIKNYNYILLTYLKLTDYDMHVYIMEKPKPKISNIDDINFRVKDGVHIMYPNICTNVKIQYYFRELIVMKISEDKLLEHLELDNSIDDVVDKSVIERNGWLLYGSTKDNNKDSLYELTAIYDYKLNNIIGDFDDDDDFKRDLPETLSIRKYNTSDKCSEFRENITMDIIEEKYNSIVNKNISNNKKYITNSDIEKVKILLNMLSIKRIQSYNSWIELGFCLHNIDDSLLDDWIEISKKDIKTYKQGECEKLWMKFKYEGLNIGSLYRWAKEDNYESYTNFLLDELDDIIKKSLDSTSYNIAKVFYEFNKFQYVCIDIKAKKWYEYVEHRWIPMNEATGIINKLNTELSNQYIKLSIAYNMKSLTDKLDDNDKKKLRDKAVIANKIAKKLNGMPFKKEIINELLHLYYKSDFYANLDENNDLIGFKNGVYDLKNQYFRNGRPEDLISFSTHVDYIPFNPNNDKIKAVNDFFESIQPEYDLREYLLRKLSTCLEGHNRYQHFEIWTGSGANGKGRIMKLMIDAMGDYACTLPVSFLTKKSGDSENASPCLSRTKGKRIAVFQEPEQSDCIYVGKMKALTGGDKIMSRALYSEPVEFYIKWKPILVCNRLPCIPSNDQGTWRRIRVLPFEIKFVADPTEPNERKRLNNLDDLINEWHSAFLSILIETYKRYIREGIFEPEKVLINTNQYQNLSDIYSEYIKQKFIITKDKKDKLDIDEVFIDYKNWLKDYNTAEYKKLKKSDFNFEMYQKLNFNNNNEFIGIKYKTRFNDNNSDDELDI